MRRKTQRPSPEISQSARNWRGTLPRAADSQNPAWPRETKRSRTAALSISVRPPVNSASAATTSTSRSPCRSGSADAMTAALSRTSHDHNKPTCATVRATAAGNTLGLAIKMAPEKPCCGCQYLDFLAFSEQVEVHVSLLGNATKNWTSRPGLP